MPWLLITDALCQSLWSRSGPPPPSRSSARIAAKSKQTRGSVLAQAQRLLCQRLGVPAGAAEECRQHIAAVLRSPLDDGQMVALEDLVAHASARAAPAQVTAVDA